MISLVEDIPTEPIVISVSENEVSLHDRNSALTTVYPIATWRRVTSRVETLIGKFNNIEVDAPNVKF